MSYAYCHLNYCMRHAYIHTYFAHCQQKAVISLDLIFSFCSGLSPPAKKNKKNKHIHAIKTILKVTKNATFNSMAWLYSRLCNSIVKYTIFPWKVMLLFNGTITLIFFYSTYFIIRINSQIYNTYIRTWSKNTVQLLKRKKSNAFFHLKLKFYNKI